MKFYLCIICQISLFNFCSSAEAKSLNDDLAKIKLKYGGEEAKILDQKTTFTKLNNHEIFTSSFILNNNKYKFEVISSYEKNKFKFASTNLIALILAAYEDQPAPYAGTISNRSKCSASFRPKIYKNDINNFHTETVVADVNTNHEFGICDEKLLKYNSCTSFVYMDDIKYYIKLNISIPRGKGTCLSFTENFYKNLRQINEH